MTRLLVFGEDEKSLNTALDIVDRSAGCSGLRAYFDKTQVLQFGAKRGCGESYKLASTCIASRLKPSLDILINEDQTGFLSGRFIGENIRTVYDVMYCCEKNRLPGMLL